MGSITLNHRRLPSSPLHLHHRNSTDEGVWCRQVSEENERALTDEQRERERAEIIEHFGPGMGNVLRRVCEARERRAETNSLPQGPEGSGLDRNDAVKIAAIEIGPAPAGKQFSTSSVSMP